MLFNSFEFLIFLPIVFCLYWFVNNKSLKWQNALLLFSSYVFYAWWDWRFLFLLLFSTGLDYLSGIKIFDAKNDKTKTRWMWFSVIVNLGFLCFFKYYNFFVDSWVSAFAHLGYKMNPWTLKIILPVGISFYTFHGLSYIIDIYNDRIEPTRNWVDYCLFVSYFPLLVAGPIERATHLLPQIKQKRTFNYDQGVDGIRLMIWGLFKKIVIADSLAPFVNDTFLHYNSYGWTSLLLAAIFFAVQIYADFSGYTDIARGVSKLFGIELLLNFNFPYFSKSIPEFWHRWHISLSSWLNDYVYTPLALQYRNMAKWGIYLAIMITFLISGLWHGAGWNYIVWGGLHGVFYFPYVILSKRKFKSISSGKSDNNPIRIKEMPSILITFSLVTLALIFFRSTGLFPSLVFLKNLFQGLIFHPALITLTPKHIEGLIFVVILFSFDYVAYHNSLKKKLQSLKYLNNAFDILLIFTIINFLFKVDTTSFIYFQF